jgi:hypothetical protein
MCYREHVFANTEIAFLRIVSIIRIKVMSNSSVCVVGWVSNWVDW